MIPLTHIRHEALTVGPLTYSRFFARISECVPCSWTLQNPDPRRYTVFIKVTKPTEDCIPSQLRTFQYDSFLETTRTYLGMESFDEVVKLCDSSAPVAFLEAGKQFLQMRKGPVRAGLANSDGDGDFKTEYLVVGKRNPREQKGRRAYRRLEHVGPVGKCSSDCGGGIQTRKRSCQSPPEESYLCEGVLEEGRPCNSQACTNPKTSKGRHLSRSQSLRSVDNRKREDVDKARPGSQSQQPGKGAPASATLAAWVTTKQRHSNTKLDSASGEEWSAWSVCSATCGEGWQSRTRFCVSSSYSTQCSGPLREQRPCNNSAVCPGKPRPRPSCCPAPTATPTDAPPTAPHWVLLLCIKPPEQYYQNSTECTLVYYTTGRDPRLPAPL
ncbi:hypothetical protein WMY93_007504 [Mugilogobius chulae]|uniref:Adhesion G protein-coupled receptor B N-terminal domain-containing protein n=1 Tax=Mugilogobius chulae TaxID=88201 RepID=A0AAW0PJP0_9GOBI